MEFGMKRRDLLGAIAATVAWPSSASAQQPRIPIVGFLGFASPAIDAAIYQPFRKALADLGYVEGRSIVVEIRSANGDIARGLAILDELAMIPVNVLLAPG